MLAVPAYADRFLKDLEVGLAQFGLTLNEDKTRVLQFGRFAAQARGQHGCPRQRQQITFTSDVRPDTMEVWMMTNPGSPRSTRRCAA